MLGGADRMETSPPFKQLPGPRGLSAGLYSIPCSAPTSTLELRPGPDFSIFDGLGAWEVQEVDCESTGCNPEELVLQSQERLREHSAKKMSAGIVEQRHVVQRGEGPASHSPPTFVTPASISNVPIDDAHTPEVVNKSLEFVSEILSGCTVDFDKYEVFRLPLGLRASSTIEYDIPADEHATKEVIFPATPITESSRIESNENIPGTEESRDDGEFVSSRTRTYLHVAPAKTSARSDHSELDALIKDESLEMEVLQSHGLDPSSLHTTTSSLSFPPPDAFLTEADEMSEKESIPLTSLSEEIDGLLQSSETLLRRLHVLYHRLHPRKLEICVIPLKLTPLNSSQLSRRH